jgi:ubiquinone biosynthesis protein
LNELDVNGLFRDLVTLLISNKIELPTNIYIMTKALVLIESIGLRLNPEFNLLGLLQKISRRIYQERLKPEKIGRAALDAAGEYGELLQQLPGDISELLKSLKGGRLRVSFNVNGLERLRRTLDDINFRLVFGIVLAAVLVSSSLIIQAGVPPLISGIPLLGLIGFAVSGVLGLGLLISMVARVFRR